MLSDSDTVSAKSSSEVPSLLRQTLDGDCTVLQLSVQLYLQAHVDNTSGILQPLMKISGVWLMG